MSRRLRICFVAACPVPSPRGTPIRAARFAEALGRRGHEVHLVTYGDGTGPVDPSVILHRIRRFSSIRVEQPGPTLGKLAVLDPLLAARLRGVTRDHSFDVVHAHHYEGLMVALVGGSKAPIVYDAHTVLETELPEYGGGLRLLPTRRVGRVLDRGMPGLATFVVTASDRLRDHLLGAGAVDPERIETIGNGVELEHFPEPASPEPAPTDGGILVYAGNLAPYQGIDYLLDGFRLVLERRPHAQLRVLTDSPSTAFEDQARRLGVLDRIQLRSVAVRDLSAELSAAHVAINPRPRCDGVPQKNLNYMAAGSPLVAFDGSLHPYVDGESGIGVTELSGEALGTAVLDLLGRPDDRIRFGRAARAALERDFTWDKQAARLEHVYHRLIADPR